MRLAIFIGSLITLILISRWFMLGENQISPGIANSVEEAIDKLQDFPPATDSNVALAVFAKPIAESSLNTLNKIAGEVPSGDALSTHSDLELSGRARKVLRLVRAEYEIPQKEAAVLLQLNPKAIFETCEISSENPGMIILQVTTDEASQEALCKLIAQLYPKPVSATAGL